MPSTRVLRHRDFRLLWLGQSASVLGDRLVVVALALLVIQRTGSATDLGLVLAAQALPLIAFVLFGGVLADRLPRHRVMIATDLVRGSLHAALAALVFADAVTIWQLVLIEAGFGAAEAFFRPAYTGLVPQTVPEPEVQEAWALSGASESTATFLGPALATALVVTIGAGWAFAIDAATFALSAALLAGVRPRDRTALAPVAVDRPVERRGSVAGDPGGAPSSVLADLCDGWGEVRSRRWVWATIAAFAGAVFVALAPWFVLGPVIARDVYGSTSVYGVLEAAFGAGTIVGTLVGTRWRPLRPLRAAFAVVTPWPLLFVVYALGVPIAALIPAGIVAGAGIGLFGVWWETSLAQNIPPDRLSRVSAYDWMGSGALLPLGYAVAGPLGAALGAPEVLAGGSLLAIGVLIAGGMPRETRELRYAAIARAPQ